MRHAGYLRLDAACSTRQTQRASNFQQFLLTELLRECGDELRGR